MNSMDSKKRNSSIATSGHASDEKSSLIMTSGKEGGKRHSSFLASGHESEGKTPHSNRRQIQPVIVGADFCGYAYIRCFWEAFHVRSIMLASANIKALSCSRFVHFQIFPQLDQEKVLLDALEHVAHEILQEGKTPLLVGCGDHYAKLISKNKEHLAQFFTVCYPDFQQMEKLTQKDYFYQICEEESIPFPRTIYLDCSKKPSEISADLKIPFDFPVIAKPANSAEYHYAQVPQKKKVYTIQTKKELLALYQNLCASCYNRNLVVQERVPGPDNEIRIVSAFMDENSSPLFLLSGRVMLEDHSPTAIGNPAVIIPENNQEVLKEAEKFLKAVKFVGMANFDVKYDPREKKFKFFEINPRPGRSSFFVYQAGINFAEVMANFYLRHDSGDANVSFQKETKDYLYTTVPSLVWKKSIRDKRVLEILKEKEKTGVAHFPLFWKKDALLQRFWAAVNYFNQIPKFKKFLWDQEKREPHA